jgi:exodeoxyribonuclease V alpha subunit
MIATNDLKLNLYNGEVGVLVRTLSRNRDDYPLMEGDFALFSDRKIPALLLPRFEYAYCLSVHKSQGSEFDHVLVLLPDGSEKFGKEMLYTAATRARKKLEVWGNVKTVDKILQKNNIRLSGIL